MHAPTQKTCTWMFTATLFIIATSGNSPNVYQLMNSKYNVVCQHNGIVFGNKKEMKYYLMARGGAADPWWRTWAVLRFGFVFMKRELISASPESRAVVVAPLSLVWAVSWTCPQLWDPWERGNAKTESWILAGILRLPRSTHGQRLCTRRNLLLSALWEFRATRAWMLTSWVYRHHRVLSALHPSPTTSDTDPSLPPPIRADCYWG